MRAFIERIAVLAALAAVAGCQRANMPPPVPPPRGPSFLVLGDSYSIGEGVAPKDRWPEQLAERLRAKGVAVSDPWFIARTGWTTDELMAAAKAAPPGPHALVSLLVGVNDEYRGGTPDAYRPRFVAMLQRAIELAGGKPGRVVVVSIPDWSVTPFAANRDRAALTAQIDRFNAVNRDETTKAGARYVEITVGSRRAATDATLLADDGLHPSGKMYAEWADAALAAAAAALKE